jgi:hypothetical protein
MINKEIQKKDLELGEKGENNTQGIIEKFLSIKLTKSTDKYATFDYYNDNTFIELKTRRVKHNTYSTLMFGYNKFKKGLEHIKEGKDVYFFFNCLDGVYYWKLTEESKKHITIGSGGRRDRGQDESNQKLVFVSSHNLICCK